METVDNARKYNREVLHMNCHKIWGRAWSSAESSVAKALLENSWSCDLDMYPHACPDPHGIKQQYANALRAVGKGMSPSLQFGMVD